jgi:precorrin-3B C17-methyltransferase
VSAPGNAPAMRAGGAATAAGWLVVAGLGPGADEQTTPEVSAALAEATDVVGYFPYVARVAPRPGLALHASDNRVELDRATLALRLAAAGRRVVVVSSGDPGVFAMASALFEALEAGDVAWRGLDVRVLPGITAMLAAAARAGAPLGHDFCAINLSDNLKPWALVERRLRLAVEADFAMAFYNPRSVARPEGFARALTVLREATEAAGGPARPVIFARAVSTPEERIRVVALPDARPEMADMRTVVIVGSSLTRTVERDGAPWVYTPRSAPRGAGA